MSGTERAMAERRFTLALALHDAGWLDKAAAAYREVLSAVPDHVGALHLLGMLLLAQDKTEEAVALLRTAVGAEPEGARLHTALADALHGTGDLVMSEEHYRRALGLEPDRTDSLMRYGNLLRREARPAEAQRMLDRALTLRPGDPVLLGQSASVLLDLDEEGAAERCLREALAADDGSADLHRRLGDLLAGGNRHEEALESYDRAIVSSYDDLEARFGRAAALEALGRCEDAVHGLNDAVAVMRTPDALLRLLRRLFDLGDAEGAMAVYRRFLPMNADRQRFPGAPTRCLTIRPAAVVCAAQGWPYRVVEPSRTHRLTPAGRPEMVLTQPDAFLARVEDAEIVPASHAVIAGGALILDGLNTSSRASVRLMPNIVAHAPDDRILLDLPPPAQTVEEEAILLGGGPNWSHGVMDWSSKLAVLERAPELSNLPVLVASRTPRSILDLFEMLGVERARIRRLPPDGSVCARRLHVPSLTHVYQYTSPVHVEFLRRRLADRIADGMAGPRRRLYLTRRHAGYRALVNEAEVLAALAPLGVEAVVPEELSMAGQIALFASAELIVGPIGGGSAAIAFARPDAAYLELAHRRIALPQYGILTAIIGQRYRQLIGPERGNRGPSEFDYDFTIPPEAVAGAARSLLDGL